MKNSIIPLSIFILLSGSACRSYRNSAHMESNRQTAYQEQLDFRQGYRSYTHDSSNRIWHFWTDKDFSYHQDSGLLAHSGYLWITENGQSKTAAISSTESRYAQFQHDREGQRNSWEKKRTAIPLWAIALLLAGSLIGIGWLYYRYNPFRRRR